MDLSRAVYSRDLKIAAMRALDAGSTVGEIARKYQASPHLPERWRGEWRAKGDLAFPGIKHYRRGSNSSTQPLHLAYPRIRSYQASRLTILNRKSGLSFSNGSCS